MKCLLAPPLNTHQQPGLLISFLFHSSNTSEDCALLILQHSCKAQLTAPVSGKRKLRIKMLRYLLSGPIWGQRLWLSTPQAACPSETVTGLSPEKLHMKENTSLSRKNKHIYTQAFSKCTPKCSSCWAEFTCIFVFRDGATFSLFSYHSDFILKVIF